MLLYVLPAMMDIILQPAMLFVSNAIQFVKHALILQNVLHARTDIIRLTVLAPDAFKTVRYAILQLGVKSAREGTI